MLTKDSDLMGWYWLDGTQAGNRYINDKCLKAWEIGGKLDRQINYDKNFRSWPSQFHSSELHEPKYYIWSCFLLLHIRIITLCNKSTALLSWSCTVLKLYIISMEKKVKLNRTDVASQPQLNAVLSVDRVWRHFVNRNSPFSICAPLRPSSVSPTILYMFVSSFVLQSKP